MVKQASSSLKTSVDSDGKVIVSAGDTRVTYQRPAFGLAKVELSGKEDPQLTQLFFTLLQAELSFDQRRQPRSASAPAIDLFVDAERVTGHGLMFKSWIQFLLKHRQRLNSIHILAVNQVSQLSVEIIRHLSGTDHLIFLYETSTEFHQVLRQFAVPWLARPRPLLGTIDRNKHFFDSLQPYRTGEDR